MTMPLSTMSAASSGGVRSRQVRTVSTIVMTGSRSASRISSSVMTMVFGMPSMRSRPLTSIDGIPKTIVITDEEIREALREPVMTIVETVRTCLERTPTELAADIVDKGIVIAGGGALLLGLYHLLRQETNLP